MTYNLERTEGVVKTKNVMFFKMFNL